jgi:hypothetical protein
MASASRPSKRRSSRIPGGGTHRGVAGASGSGSDADADADAATIMRLIA